MRHTQSSRIRVENHSNLARDVKTKAIVNTDNSAYLRYVNDKNIRLRQQDEINLLRSEIDSLKQLILQQNK